MRDKNSKYGLRPEETNATVQEIWKLAEILEFCDIMNWDMLAAKIKALPITAKEKFTDKLKHGDVQIVLYRNVNEIQFDSDCPFHFTIEGCFSDE